MKRLFILLGLIGVIHVSAGFNTSAKLGYPKKELKDAYSADLRSFIKPSFTQIDGSMFLAINTDAQIEIEDGDVVEFTFNNRTRIISFHVNDINQDFIDTGNASLLVMVHNELVLSLKSHRLKRIIIRHKNVTYSLPVDAFWMPHQYMTSL